MTEEVTPSETPLTLESVKAKFDAWRQRPGTRRPFPKAFWLDVIALQKDYKLSKILTALKISRAQLESKERQLAGKAKPDKKAIAPANEFIAVNFDSAQQMPLPEVTELNVAEGLSIELTRPDGTVLKVGQLSAQAVETLITRFIA